MNLNINPPPPPLAPPMHSHSEIILATIAGDHEDEQLEVALCQVGGEGSHIELRQQTWSNGIGWFTQSRVRLEPHQVGELRGVLGTSAGGTRKPNSRQNLPQEFSTVSQRSFVPKVVRADSA